MVLAIAAITTLALWDVERESAAALGEFADDQAILADALAVALEEKDSADQASAKDVAPEKLSSAIRTIDQPGEVRVFVSRPGTEGLISHDGTVVRSSVLEGHVTGTVRLTREEAAAVGLPARTALAGVRRIETGGLAGWSVAVVATAQDHRDRHRRARFRLVLVLLGGSGLVLLFGGMAMRKQRKEIELEHALAVTTLRNARDERLIRADKLATMGALATGIAHEVATPLGVILARAEQLLPRQPDERSRRAVQAIAQEIGRINGVIRGFLGLARGGQPLLQHCNPGDLASTAIALVEHRFEKAGVHLEARVPEGLSKIACEPRLLEQVLVNLLLNACDACEAGGAVALTVDEDKGRIFFHVEDDGVGIPEDEPVRVTEPFFTTKAEGQGTGLGLAIANEIVKHHCGSLALRRRETGGTNATVELPIGGVEAHA
jgi:signal transduction histidine kinase